MLLIALGSGVYSGDGPLNYTYNADSGSRLVTASVPIKKTDTEPDKSAVEPRMMKPSSQDNTGRTLSHFENITFYSKGRVHLLSLILDYNFVTTRPPPKITIIFFYPNMCSEKSFLQKVTIWN